MTEIEFTSPVDQLVITERSWLNRVWQLCQRQIANNTLPHALLLSGAAAAGCDDLAKYVAQAVLCAESSCAPCGECRSCHWSMADHPDCQLLCGEVTKRIGVEAIRSMAVSLQNHGVNGHGRVVVISAAENMTVAAANALLKVLEEPPANVHFVMTVSNAMLLIPTILSRVTHHAVQPGIQDFTATDGDSALAWRLNEYVPVSKSTGTLSQDYAIVIEALAPSLPGTAVVNRLQKLDFPAVITLLQQVIEDVLWCQSGGTPAWWRSDNLPMQESLMLLANAYSRHQIEGVWAHLILLQDYVQQGVTLYPQSVLGDVLLRLRQTSKPAG